MVGTSNLGSWNGHWIMLMLNDDHKYILKQYNIYIYIDTSYKLSYNLCNMDL